jgi:hypothetical protein
MFVISSQIAPSDNILSRSLRSFLRLFYVFFALMILTGSAFAASPEIPPLNRKVEMAREDFIAATKEFTVTPFVGQDIQINFRLPESWQQVGEINKADMPTGLLTNVTSFISPVRSYARSIFYIKAVKLPFMIGVKDWALNYIKINNFTLQGLAQVDEARLQAQYVAFENGQTYGVRMVAQRVGSTLFFIEYRAPVENWSKERDQAIWSITLTKINTSMQKPAEETDVYSFAGLVTFSYPQSWVLQSEPITSTRRMKTALINLKGGVPLSRDVKISDLVMDGRIDIDVIAKGEEVTLKTEIARMKESLDESGFLLGDLIETVPNLARNKQITFSRVDAYKFNDRAQRLIGYELWVGVFETQNHFYIVKLLTLGRDADRLIWARNKAAFDYVVKTLEESNESR